MQSRVQPSSGTGTMIPLVNSGEIDIGFANTLELWDAFHGKGTFDKRPNPNLRTVGGDLPDQVGLFVRADLPIKTIKDMKGKTVVLRLYQPGNHQAHGRRHAGDRGGLTAADLKTVLVPNLVRGVDELMSGRVDITTFAIGSAKVSEADAAVGIRYIPLPNTPEALAAMQKVFRTAYIAKVEPAANLAGVKEPMHLMGYDYTVFANKDVPEARIKTVTA